MMLLPYWTAELPGVGGTLRTKSEDFVVDEVPAYAPTGEGSHVLARIEKRDLSTFAAINQLARALDVNPNDVGSAGLKDTHAVTRQWLSFPPPTTPESISAVSVDGVTVLEAHHHPHKLRTGHLRGNRFELLIRGANCLPREAAARAREILGRLHQPPGVPNWFGAQRFGARGDNAEVGRALVTGGRAPRVRGRKRRLFISAFQSQMFNDYLRRRLDDGCFGQVIEGDVLAVVASGGVFVSEDVAADQPRLDNAEVVPTGPMFGHKMKSPAPGSAAAAREDAILTAEGLALPDFARVGKLAQGTRRPLAVRPISCYVDTTDEGLLVRFLLPPGTYATAVMREVIKGDTNFPG